MFALFKSIVNLLDCGVMDLLRVLESFLNRVYIRHREYDDLT